MKYFRLSLLFVIILSTIILVSFILSSQNAYSSQRALGVKVGDKAPDISMKNSNDSIITLYSVLKNKLVLIDFWASWCGPCRAENPNVVATYNKYKDEKFKEIKCKGFTVFSISLDKDKTSWKNAITKDGLVWPYHVSDLKFWNNQAAQSYGVNFIPYNFLVDKDGTVIAIGLRGAALDNKLEELKNK